MNRDERRASSVPFREIKHDLKNHPQVQEKLKIIHRPPLFSRQSSHRDVIKKLAPSEWKESIPEARGEEIIFSLNVDPNSAPFWATDSANVMETSLLRLFQIVPPSIALFAPQNPKTFLLKDDFSIIGWCCHHTQKGFAAAIFHFLTESIILFCPLFSKFLHKNYPSLGDAIFVPSSFFSRKKFFSLIKKCLRLFSLYKL